MLELQRSGASAEQDGQQNSLQPSECVHEWYTIETEYRKVRVLYRLYISDYATIHRRVAKQCLCCGEFDWGEWVEHA